MGAIINLERLCHIHEVVVILDSIVNSYPAQPSPCPCVSVESKTLDFDLGFVKEGDARRLKGGQLIRLLRPMLPAKPE